MARVTLSITEAERAALVELARAELRDPRAQGTLLLRQALERAGYLSATTTGDQPAKTYEVNHA
ncbi:MAG TPA: hypothetical protein PKL67_18045 [Anaerolineae bacterium]|nr:hypothetical protein [Anaerolineae bacterium]